MRTIPPSLGLSLIFSFNCKFSGLSWFNNFFRTLLDTALKIEPMKSVNMRASRRVARRTKNEMDTKEDAVLPINVTN
jgi:hypothetical protein